MKKIGFTLCIITIYFYVATANIYGKSLAHINTNLNETDIAVTFLTSENTKLLYVQNEKQNIAIILEALSQVNIKYEFPVLEQEKIDGYILLHHDIEDKLIYENVTILEDILYLEDSELKKIDENMILVHDSKKLCVIQDKMSDIGTCDYVYYLGLEEIMEIPDTVKLVIYDAGIRDDMRLANYDNFIDTLKLSYQDTATLIWNKDTYRTMIY